MYYKYSIFK